MQQKRNQVLAIMACLCVLTLTGCGRNDNDKTTERISLGDTENRTEATDSDTNHATDNDTNRTTDDSGNVNSATDGTRSESEGVIDEIGDDVRRRTI